MCERERLRDRDKYKETHREKHNKIERVREREGDNERKRDGEKERQTLCPFCIVWSEFTRNKWTIIPSLQHTSSFSSSYNDIILKSTAEP